MSVNNIVPTFKQKKALKLYTEYNGNTYRAMIDAGYNHNTAKKPTNLTESVGWKILLSQQLPDNYLLKKHKQLLNKKEKDGQPETTAVSKGLDMAYKLKGSYAPEKHQNTNIDITSVLCSIIDGKEEGDGE